MKIVAISDTHGSHRQLVIPECDMLVHAGDITNMGELPMFNDFVRWFAEQPAKRKVFVAGNHDFCCQKMPHVIKGMIPSNVVYLENDWAILDNIAIYGSPWTPYFYDWAYNGTDREEGDDQGPNLNSIWSRCPTELDIMITHGPMHGHLSKNREGHECGSKMLLKHVKRVKPKIHICGHIHEGYGHKIVAWEDGSSTRCYNVSSLGRDYETINKPWEIEL